MEFIEHYSSDAVTLSGKDGSLERVYHVLDGVTGVAVLNYIRLYAPTTDPETGLVRGPISVESKGAGVYEARVKYGKIENQAEVSFNTSPERTKITKSRRTVASFKVRDLTECILLLDGLHEANDVEIDVVDAGLLPDSLDFPFILLIENEQVLITGRGEDDLTNRLTAERGHNGTLAQTHLSGTPCVLLMPGPDFGGLINVQGDKVNGVDWYAQSMKFTAKWSSKFLSLRPDFVETLERLGGCVNNSDIAISIRGQQFLFQEGEVVALGGTCNQGSDDGASISVNFEVSRNGYVEIGERDGTNNTWRSKIWKRGWDVGWISTVKRIGNRGVHVEVPDAFHIEEVARYVDFSQFEIFDMLVAQEDLRLAQIEAEEEAQQEEDDE